MATICLIGIDRPGLVHHLAMRGLGVDQLNRLDELAGMGAAVLCVNMAHTGQQLEKIRARWAGAIMLIAAGCDGVLVTALDAGYDDAVAASSSDALIAARLAALVRWHSNARYLRIGDLVIDTIDCRVTRGGHRIALLPREYRLLLELARRPGQVVSRQVLVAALCGLSFDPGTKVIEVHVSRLRAKIDRDFGEKMVVTEKGLGYRLVAGSTLPTTEMEIAATAASG